MWSCQRCNRRPDKTSDSCHNSPLQLLVVEAGTLFHLFQGGKLKISNFFKTLDFVRPFPRKNFSTYLPKLLVTKGQQPKMSLCQHFPVIAFCQTLRGKRPKIVTFLLFLCKKVCLK